MTTPTPGQLAARDEVIWEFRRSLSGTKHGLGTVPNMVKVVVREAMWQDRVIRQTGERVTFSSFSEFVTAAPLNGLGATLSQLRGICRDDPEALDALDRAMGNRQGERTDLGVNHSKATDKKRDRSGQHLRRLRKDFPDVHAEVLAGRLTVHEASIQAGIFPKRASINLSSAESAAETIARSADPTFIADLARRLLDGLQRVKSDRSGG